MGKIAAIQLITWDNGNAVTIIEKYPFYDFFETAEENYDTRVSTYRFVDGKWKHDNSFYKNFGNLPKRLWKDNLDFDITDEVDKIPESLYNEIRNSITEEMIYQYLDRL